MCQESLARPPPLGCRQAQAANVFSIRTTALKWCSSREKSVTDRMYPTVRVSDTSVSQWIFGEKFFQRACSDLEKV